MFTVGDTVALSGALVIQLAEEHPPVFEHLRNAQRHGGKITEIDGNTVVIDVGLEQPIRVDIDPSVPEQLQLIQRVPAQPTAPPGTRIATNDQLPPGFQQVIQSILGGQGPAQGAAAQPRVPPYPIPPEYVRMAQWVVVHFTELKKLVYSQHIIESQRNAQYRALRPPGGIAEVYDSDHTPIRAELSGAETKLYEDALESLGEWLSQLRDRDVQDQNTPCSD